MHNLPFGISKLLSKRVLESLRDSKPTTKRRSPDDKAKTFLFMRRMVLSHLSSFPVLVEADTIGNRLEANFSKASGLDMLDGFLKSNGSLELWKLKATKRPIRSIHF